MNKFGFVALAFATCLAGVPAIAAPMTASGGTIGISGPTDYNSMIGYLAKFNSAAGTLQSVTLTVGYGFNSNITLSSTTNSSGSVRTVSAAQFDSSDAGVKAALDDYVNVTSSTIGASSLSPAAYDLYGTSRVYSLSAGTSSNYSSAASASNSYVITNASFLNAFLASPASTVFDVYGKTLTGLVLMASGGNASATQQTIASQNISILYTYEEPTLADVPEPAMLGLFGLGAIGLGLTRRRKTA